MKSGVRKRPRRSASLSVPRAERAQERCLSDTGLTRDEDASAAVRGDAAELRCQRVEAPERSRSPSLRSTSWSTSASRIPPTMIGHRSASRHHGALRLVRRLTGHGSPMSRRPLVLSLLALAAVVTAVVLPAGATLPGDNGKIVFERPTPNGSNLFTVNPARLALEAAHRSQRRRERRELVGGRHQGRLRESAGPGERPIRDLGRERQRQRPQTTHPAPRLQRRARVFAGRAQDRLRHRWRQRRTSQPLRDERRRLRPGTAHASRRGKSLHGSPVLGPTARGLHSRSLKGSGNRPRKFDSSIAIVNAFDGSAFRRLTPAGGPDELNPNWAPQGEDLAYERTKRFPVKQSDIALIHFDRDCTSGASRRPRCTRRTHRSQPDGTRIAFTSDRDNRRLSKDRLGRGFELYTMALDGRDIERVTHNRKPDLFPDWQPLGR